MQAWNTLGQRPAAVTNPVVRVCFRDGPFFTNAAMTVATATTNSAAIRFRRHVGLCPCLFRGTSLDQKKTLVVHPVVFLSHPLDRSVAHINRIKSHLTFLLQGSLTLRVASQATLTRQKLLSTIEQSRKELLPGTAAGTPDRDHLERYFDVGCREPITRSLSTTSSHRQRASGRLFHPSANWTFSPLPYRLSQACANQKETAKDFPYRHEAGFLLAQ